MKNGRDMIEMHEVQDGGEAARARKQREQFDRNSAWLQEHLADIYRANRGKCVCVAGGEAFIADDAKDAIAQATAAHPDDQGWFTRYIPRERVDRVYAV